MRELLIYFQAGEIELSQAIRTISEGMEEGRIPESEGISLIQGLIEALTKAKDRAA